MVYCAVKGCNNKINSKNKNARNPDISYHPFPWNPELKAEWLRVIGRPNWVPPHQAMICSIHFNPDQISRGHINRRIVARVCPVNALPPSSNFDAYNVEVCRICLAADLRLYSLEDGMLNTCMDSFAPFTKDIIEGLPKFVCYECAALMKKCYYLLEKSKVAQATLFDISANNGQVTKDLVKSKNREKLHLTSSLTYIPSLNNDYHFQYDDEQNNSQFMDKNNVSEDVKLDIVKVENEGIFMFPGIQDENLMEYVDNKNEKTVKVEEIETYPKDTEEIGDQTNDKSEETVEVLMIQSVEEQVGNITYNDNKNKKTFTVEETCSKDTKEVGGQSNDECEILMDTVVSVIIINDDAGTTEKVDRLNSEENEVTEEVLLVESDEKQNIKPHCKKRKPSDTKQITKTSGPKKITKTSGTKKITKTSGSKKNTKTSETKRITKVSETKKITPTSERKINRKPSGPKEVKTRKKKPKQDRLVTDVIKLRAHYDIVELSFEEQLDQWTDIVNNSKSKSLSLQCGICLKCFGADDAYQFHMRGHEPVRGNAECPVCKMRFSTEYRAYEHVTVKHSKRYFCKYCPRVIYTMAKAKEHIKHRHEGTVYRCSHCAFQSVHEKSLRAHERRSHVLVHAHACAHCELTFRTQNGLKCHVGVAHKNVKETEPTLKFRCEECAINFLTEEARSVHLRTATRHKMNTESISSTASDIKPYATCSVCGQEFISMKLLLIHKKDKHSNKIDPPSDGDDGETKPREKYECEECNIIFLTEEARNVHLQTAAVHKMNAGSTAATTSHLKPKVPCAECGLEFISIKQLLLHKKVKHSKKNNYSVDDCYPKQCDRCDVTVNSRREGWLHFQRQHYREPGARYESVRPLMCETCGKAFQNPANLRFHVLRHKSRSVRCELCPKLFYDKNALATHMVSHSDDVPYRCEVCGKGFKYRPNFNRHRRIVHSDIARYECQICGNKFKHSSSVNLHIRTVHEKIPTKPRKRVRKNVEPK